VVCGWLLILGGIIFVPGGLLFTGRVIFKWLVGRPRGYLVLGRLEIHGELWLPDLPEFREELCRGARRLCLRLFARLGFSLPTGGPIRTGPRAEG